MALSTFRRTLLHTLAGADPENSERGGRYNCLLKAPFYFAENSIKKILYFKEKVVTAAPSATPKSALDKETLNTRNKAFTNTVVYLDKT